MLPDAHVALPPPPAMGKVPLVGIWSLFACGARGPSTGTGRSPPPRCGRETKSEFEVFTDIDSERFHAKGKADSIPYR